MLARTTRQLLVLFSWFLVIFSSFLLLADSVRYLNSVVLKVGIDPLVSFIICWTVILILRIGWIRKMPPFLFNIFLYIVIPVSTLIAVGFTFIELNNYYNYVYSHYFIQFERLGMWCFSSWMFGLVLIPEKIFQKWFFKIIFLAPVLFVVGMSLVWFWPQDVFLKLVEEDSLIENLQVFVLAIGSISAFLLSKKLWLNRQVLLAILFLLVSLGLFFIAGDEISWGQRLLGFATPAEIAKDNLQHEVTLHNLDGIHQLIGYGYILVGLYGSFAWVLADLFFRKQEKWLKYFVPGQYLFFYFYLSLVYNSYSLGGPHAYGEWAEVAELLLYLGVSLFLVIVNLRINKNQ